MNILQVLVLCLALPEIIVLDPFGGTISLAVACLTLLRKFIGTKSKKNCFEIALCKLEDFFSRVLLAANYPYTLFGPYTPTAEYIEDLRLLLVHGGYESTLVTTKTTKNLSKRRPPAELPVPPILPI